MVEQAVLEPAALDERGPGRPADMIASWLAEHGGVRADERGRSSGEVRPGTYASCLCSRIHYGRHQRIMGMTLKLIWINGPGRDLSQFRAWSLLTGKYRVRAPMGAGPRTHDWRSP